MIRAARNSRSPEGFTFIEVIAILLLMGIIGSVAISRYSSTDPFKLVKETETLKGHIHHSRIRSMGDTVPWGINISADSYTLEKNGSTSPFNLPGEDSATHNFSDGVTVTTGAGSVVIFDKWGNPGLSDITVILALGSESRTITISRDTGFMK